MKKLIYSFLLVQSISLTWGSVRHDEVFWLNFNSFIKIKDNWQFYNEVQPRFTNQNQYLSTILYRAALGYEFPTKLSFWAGYGFIENQYPNDFYEHRPFFQIMKVHGEDKSKWIHRARFEHRNLQDRDESPLRARYLLRLQYHLENNWYMVVWNEIFYHLSGVNQSKTARSSKPRPGFDQNRFFIGPGIKLKNPFEIFFELGYLNVFINGAQSNETILNGLAGQATFRF